MRRRGRAVISAAALLVLPLLLAAAAAAAGGGAGAAAAPAPSSWDATPSLRPRPRPAAAQQQQQQQQQQQPQPQQRKPAIALDVDVTASEGRLRRQRRQVQSPVSGAGACGLVSSLPGPVTGMPVARDAAVTFDPSPGASSGSGGSGSAAALVPFAVVEGAAGAAAAASLSEQGLAGVARLGAAAAAPGLPDTHSESAAALGLNASAGEVLGNALCGSNDTAAEWALTLVPPGGAFRGFGGNGSAAAPAFPGGGGVRLTFVRPVRRTAFWIVDQPTAVFVFHLRLSGVEVANLTASSASSSGVTVFDLYRGNNLEFDEIDIMSEVLFGWCVDTVELSWTVEAPYCAAGTTTAQSTSGTTNTATPFGTTGGGTAFTPPSPLTTSLPVRNDSATSDPLLFGIAPIWFVLLLAGVALLLCIVGVFAVILVRRSARDKDTYSLPGDGTTASTTTASRYNSLYGNGKGGGGGGGGGGGINGGDQDGDDGGDDDEEDSREHYGTVRGVVDFSDPDHATPAGSLAASPSGAATPYMDVPTSVSVETATPPGRLLPMALSPPPPPSDRFKQAIAIEKGGDGERIYTRFDPNALGLTPGRKQVRLLTLDPDKLWQGSEIGRGAFGVVYQGVYDAEDVAIKHLISAPSDAAMADFWAEAALMARIPAHENVLKFVGLASFGDNGGVAIVTELCPGLSLLHAITAQELEVNTIWFLARGLAAGMLHLSNHHVVHRDLACRNVLLGADWTPHVCDFGQSRLLHTLDAQQSTKSDVGPIKWMAPEALENRQYSTKSDVWMFGATLIEMITRREPFPDRNVLDVGSNVILGNLRPTAPPEAPPAMIPVFDGCFHFHPEDRHDFATIVQLLG